MYSSWLVGWSTQYHLNNGSSVDVLSNSHDIVGKLCHEFVGLGGAFSLNPRIGENSWTHLVGINTAWREAVGKTSAWNSADVRLSFREILSCGLTIMQITRID